MPEISDADYKQYVRYQLLGTPEEAEKKIAGLETDNKTQRDELRETKKLLPKDDQVVLPKAEVETLNKFKALGTPEDVTAKVARVGTLETELATQKADAAREAAAATLKLAGADLKSFNGVGELTFEVRNVETTAADGTTKVQTPTAFVKKGDGAEQSLLEYGKANWGRPFEALVAAPAAPAQDGNVLPFGTMTDTTPSRTAGQLKDSDVSASVQRTTEYSIL